jgi:hypothetical protein
MTNLFKTKTAATALGFILAVVVPTLPTISKSAEDVILRRVHDTDKADVTSIMAIVSAFSLAIAGLAARYSMGDCYTPRGLPGRDYEPAGSDSSDPDDRSDNK